VYYVRFRVPRDLVETLGRREIQKSLDTRDHREALRRYFPAMAERDEMFAQARRRADR